MHPYIHKHIQTNIHTYSKHQIKKKKQVSFVFLYILCTDLHSFKINLPVHTTIIVFLFKMTSYLSKMYTVL